MTLDASNTDLVYRRFVEGGPRRFNQTVTTLYGVATLDGSFDIGGGRKWYWDVNAAYGRNKAKQTMFGNINSDRLRQALGPVAACTGECVPFNIFGGVGSITQPMMDYVMFTQRDRSRQSTFSASANVTGSLFDLPGGPLGIAVGVEYRKLKGSFDPDPIVAAGFSRTSRRCRRAAAIMSRKPMPNSALRCCPTPPSSTCSNSPARCAGRTIRPRARQRR